MRFFIQPLLAIFITFAIGGEGNTTEAQDFGEVKMKSWSLGRIDFNLPKQFEIKGRAQSIYHVHVTTTPLNGKPAAEIWSDKLNKIKTIHSAAGNKQETVIIREIDSNFPVAIYRENTTMPELVTLEGQKKVDNDILTLKFQGKAGKEPDIIRLLTITAEGYHADIPYGFNVGAGSITSKPSRNEYATASFTDDSNVELRISIQTAGTYLNKHSLDDIEHEIKGLALDGITLKVLKNAEITVAGFDGYEGQISLESQSEAPEFRFTWFTPGVTADAFKPEILLKVHGPLKNIEAFKPVWEEILKSLKIRRAR